MEKKTINKRTWIIIGIVVALLAALGVGGYIISRGGAGRAESLLDLGQRYLEEMNYEQAVVCFEEYLEIDPKSVEAYAGLAEAYVGLEEYEKALEVLAEGYEVTGDGSLQELSSRIEEQYRGILLAEDSGDDEEEGQDAEPEEEFVGPLVLDASTASIAGGNGGVIITVENELYGAVNYQGKELVPHIYSRWWVAPTDDGYFALGDSEAAHVFNSEGQEVLVIEVEQPYWFSMYISDGGVLYRTAEEGIKWYDLLQGTTTDMGESKEHFSYGMTQMQDGTAYYLSSSLSDSIIVFAITSEGTEEILFRGNSVEFFGMHPSSEGYILLSGGRGWASTADFAIIRETDGKEYHIACGHPYVMNSEFSYLGDAYLPISYANIADGYYKDGMYYYSKGTQIVLYGWNDIGWNDYTYEIPPAYYLLDFANAKLGTLGSGGEYVTNPNDMILAQYDYIALSDSGYYLAGDGESWFYLDERGQKVDQTFLDCGTFYNGYAIIIDTDGMAYLIDTEFNKVSEGYPADRVFTAEAVYCAVSGDQVTILTAPEE